MFLCKLFRMAEDDQSPKSQNNRSEDGSDADPPLPLRLDLGDDSSVNLNSNRLGNQNGGPSGSNHGANETHRREENPISFKHFLRSDSGSGSQSKMTKPRVYKESRSASTDFSSRNLPESIPARMVPELSSALPDFVQDHLVIEQCYLGGGNSNGIDLNGVNLPDFTHTGNDHPSVSNSGNKAVPLDLPIRQHVPFPLDLPIGNCSNISRNSSVGEVGNSKSLPDFLADGAVCSQAGECSPSVSSPGNELQMLRQDLEVTRQQYAEQLQICDTLNRQLERRKKSDQDIVEKFTKSLQFVEENLAAAVHRAVTAESTVAKLKTEIKSLTAKVDHLTRENEHLRGEASTSQGRFTTTSTTTSTLHSQRLAEELRAAASNAELSLRQLLAGVDNLRMMADSLDSVDRIEEKEDQYSHWDDDAGPAL